MVDTGIPNSIWKFVAGDKPFTSFSSICLIFVCTTIGCQLVGNVAVIIIVEDNIDKLDDNVQRFAWLLMSWISTVAGNLTLAGSAANIIVAEKASRHNISPVRVTASSHFGVMGLLSISTIIIGCAIIYAESVLFLNL
jgi:Na+/H+ antiporter NhaD/arsenite permease-like protein